MRSNKIKAILQDERKVYKIWRKKKHSSLFFFIIVIGSHDATQCIIDLFDLMHILHNNKLKCKHFKWSQYPFAFEEC